jgi:aldehyde:ferredoxin oxidoreductase
MITVGIGGGQFGAHLKWAGSDAIIVTGRAPQPVYLMVSDGKIEIVPASHLWGQDTTEVEASIRAEQGNWDVHVATIGVAGENLVPTTTIIADRARSAGRGGAGAVMGSKNLKAVAVYGTGSVPVYDAKSAMEESLRMTRQLMTEQHFSTYLEWGTTYFLDRYTQAGGLMTFNAQRGIFPDWRDIDGRVYKEKHWLGRLACFGCPLPCSSYFQVEKGPRGGTFGEATSASTLKELGARVGVRDLRYILDCHVEVDRLGLDLISAPATVAFAVEAYEKGIINKAATGGLPLEFGRGDVVLELLRRTARREGIGEDLAHGSRACAERWGKGSDLLRSDSKGLEPPGTDPRAYPAWALGYATSSRGACHMRAYSVFEFGGVEEDQAERIGVPMIVNERLEWKGKGRGVAFFEDLRSLGDSLISCRFVARNSLAFAEEQVGILNAVTGLGFTVKELDLVGERITNLERLFNLREGLKPEDDTLPKRFLQEPLQDGASKGCVVPLEPMLEEYYAARDWDRGTGQPSDAKLHDLNLTSQHNTEKGDLQPYG